MEKESLIPFVSLAILLSAGLTILGYYLRPPRRALIYVCKPLTTVLIFITALLPGGLPPDPYATAIGIGLLFSLAGDILLMLPRCHFLMALVCFLFTHVCYALAFFAAGPGGGLAWILFVLGFIGAGILAYLWPALSAIMKAAVGAYVSVVVIMASLAVGRALANPTPGTIAAAAGALLFMFSDAVLAVNRFRRPFRAAQAVILACYFVGQWLIALSTG
ncbi:MAG: lysoplasmalogenase [Anaerolineales bacterium]|nr:lysoplasmalogenase [Anaerolineales bacterium]